MNFFEHQERARRQTRRMLVLFALAVAAIVAAVDVLVLFALGVESSQGAGEAMSVRSLLVVSVCVLVVVALGSLYRIASLRGGGPAIARRLGGVAIAPGDRAFANRRLRNVVEEIAIAAGVPVPEIFVLEEEAGINAFASGFTPADAAITVTRGALEKLTRAELQGVVGHEFSHILNGDMRLNARLMGLVFGLLVVATIGRKIAGVSSRGRDAASAVMFGLTLFAVGYIGVVFGRAIKASISRQREFLADASAVQFTRQTDGIAGALKKIAGLAEGSRLASADTEEVAHMLFGDGVGYANVFATHPPLEERIRRLDPGFSRDELARIAKAWTKPLHAESDAANASIAGFVPASASPVPPADTRGRLPRADAALTLRPGNVARQVGNPGDDDRITAHAIRTTIPQTLREAAWQGERALALVFALVISGEADQRARQLHIVGARHDEGTCGETARLLIAVDALHPLQRLPLAALAFPTLRRRPRAQLVAFMDTVRALVEADGEITLAEYCLARLLRAQVIDALNPAAAHVIGRRKLPEVAGEIAAVLAVVAVHGHEDQATAQRAYALGIGEVLPDAAIACVFPPDWAAALDRSLPKLDLLAPAGKELIVRALTRTITADGTVGVAEAELLRAVCASLHCPLPPLLSDPA